MNKLALFLALIVAASLTLPLLHAAPVGIPILIDLSHGQPASGIDIMMKVVPEAQWYILVKSEEDKEALPDIVKNLAHGIMVGDFASADLKNFEVIIIGQPQALFTPEELTALYSWFTAYPNRVIWLAADSDYPAQGSETSQKAANMVLETLGAHLRMDYVSVEDPDSCALKPYRVLGVVEYCEIPEIKAGVTKVLFHGPGAVAWVDEAGTWHKLTATEKPPETYIIATTTSSGTIVEHQAEPQGSSGKAYTPGENGVFTLMAAEFVPVEKGKGIVIVSGESPYGGYQPGVTWMYKGFRLSGPQFIRNVILWATGYMGELSEYGKIAEVKESVESLKGEISGLKGEMGDLESSLKSYVSGEISSLKGEISDAITKLANRVNTAISGVNTLVYAALGLGLIALVLAIGALALALKKK